MTTPSVAVAKYDRALLKYTEVQPVAEEDGHIITVNSMGRFAAKVGETEVVATTLEKAREKVHRNHMAQLRKAKKKLVAAKAFIVDEEDYERSAIHGEGFFRGVHGQTCDLQYAWPDGSKAFGDKVTVFRRDDPVVPALSVLLDRRCALKEETREVDKEVGGIIRTQREAMYKGERLRHGDKPQTHGQHKAEYANKLLDMVLANVFGDAGE